MCNTGVVVRWCGDYVIVWSVEYNHSFIVIDKSINYDLHELYATHWLSFEVDPEVVQSAEGLCTRAYDPRAVEYQHSLNPETTEYDYNDFNSFVYQFSQHRNTIRDDYVGEVGIDMWDLEQLVKYNIFNVDHANTKPWGLLNSTSVQSAIEQTVNMDCITVFRQMNRASVEFYVIFSKTHRFGIRCDGALNLEIGRWARLQYIGGDFRPGHFLSSQSLRLINYIAPPRFVDAKKFKMREMPDDIAEYIVILTLRARVWNYGNGDLVIESDDVGPIKVDVDWVPPSRIPSDFPKGAVVEIEFVRDSWYLRKLHGHWHDGLDLRRLDSPYIWPGYTVEDAEYRGRRYAHGVEECVERAVLRQNFNEEQPHHQRIDQPACPEPRRPSHRSSGQDMGNKSGRRSGNRDRNRALDDDRYENRGYQAENRPENRDNIPRAMNNTFSGNPTYSEPRQPRYDVQTRSQNPRVMSAGDYGGGYARPDSYERGRNEAHYEDRYGSRGDEPENRHSFPPMMNDTFPGNSAYSESSQDAYRFNAQNINDNPQRRSSRDAESNYTRQPQYCDRDRNEPHNEDRYENREYHAENRDNIPRLVNDTFSDDSAYLELTQTPDRFSDQNVNYHPERRSAHHSEYNNTRHDYYERDRHEPQREDRYESRGDRADNRRSVPYTMNKPFSGNSTYSEPRQGSDRFNAQNMIDNPEGRPAYHAEYGSARQGYYDRDRNEPQNEERYGGEGHAENRDNNPRMTNDTSSGNSAYPEPTQASDRFNGQNMNNIPERRSARYSECNNTRQDRYGLDRNEPQNENRCGNSDYRAEYQHNAPLGMNETCDNRMATRREEPRTNDHMYYSFRLPEEPSSTKHARDDYYYDFRKEEEYTEPQNDYYYNSNNFLSDVERKFCTCNIRDDSPERRSDRHSESSSTRQDYYERDRGELQDEERWYENRDYRAEGQHSIPPMMKETSGERRDWIPPVLPANEENVVHLTEERPSGRDSCPAWCCVVQTRCDHIICYAPIPGIHKILIPAGMLDTDHQPTVRLGSWVNLICEPRCKREYDDYRLPHFSHIAVEVVAGPVEAPPIENWEQREIHGLFQFRVYCDLSVPGNVQRVQMGNEKWLKLICRHALVVLAPYERLEGILSAQLTADKLIMFWATRKRRVLDCDLFLMDFENIEEV
ncbi:hypothetical protein Aduo_009720 [Ancylostoma duodenale]